VNGTRINMRTNMRKMLNAMLAVLLVLPLGALTVHAAQTDPVADIKQSREFFKKRFPTVALEDYADGLYALPMFADYREQWLGFKDLPPYEIGLENGKKTWGTPFGNGKTFAGCFKNGGKNIAQGYPYWDKTAKRLHTVEHDLMDCARRNNADLKFLTADLDRDQAARVQLAELSAYFYSMSRGQPIKPDVDLTDPDARKAYEEGKKFWWSRHGQWNFACASCHVDLAGKNLGGNQPLSAALGHTTAWPAQRLEWGRIETLHFRYATCLSQVRAKPPKQGSPIYDNLELYEKIISSGLPLKAPAMRN
jgi:sulfur-oxidizing protein SoxA